MLKKTLQNLYQGWWMVLICALISAYGAGSFHYGFSVFVHPIVTELGWDLALVSGAFSLYRLEAGVAAPLAGYLVDRMGAKKLISLGTVLMGIGYICLSQVKTVLPFYLSCLTISIGFGFSTSQVVGTSLISKWFVQKRGKALGLYFSIYGLGGLLVPILSQMVYLFGWRSTLFFLGPLTWLVVLPLGLLLKNRPEEHGLRPDGDIPIHPRKLSSGAAPAVAAEVSFSFLKALRTPSYGLLVVCLSLFQMTMSSIFVHLVPCLMTAGLEARRAALVVTFVTAVSVLGRGGSGWLSDFISKKMLLMIAFLMQAASILALLFLGGNGAGPTLIAFILLFGFSYGSIIVVRPSLVAEFYGRERFGTIWGSLQGISLAGGIAGPVFLGYIYDLQGSYSSGLIFLSLMNVAAIFLAGFLRRPGAGADASQQRTPGAAKPGITPDSNRH